MIFIEQYCQQRNNVKNMINTSEENIFTVVDNLKVMIMFRYNMMKAVVNT